MTNATAENPAPHTPDIEGAVFRLGEMYADAEAVIQKMHGVAFQMPSWEEYVRMKAGVGDLLAILTGKRHPA